MKRGGEGIGWTLALELAPAALFGGAAGLSAGTLLGIPRFDVMTLASGAAGFALAVLGLRRFCGDAHRFPMPHFEQAPIEPEHVPAVATPCPDETAATAELGELLLDHPLPAPEQDSRVVPLFDEARMPTAGELRARIERHLHSGSRAAPDATQELHEALAALRQSLR